MGEDEGGGRSGGRASRGMGGRGRDGRSNHRPRPEEEGSWGRHVGINPLRYSPSQYPQRPTICQGGTVPWGLLGNKYQLLLV